MSLSVTKIPPELKTLRDWMRWGTSQFQHLYFGHGSDNAWDEAVYLVLSALALPPDFSQQWFDTAVTADEKQKIFNLLRQRITQRIPAAYLTKEAWFAGLAFYVDTRVLIPRSPLAEIIQAQFQPWTNEVNCILEIGTGSGCIAIACAQYFPEAKIVATDICRQALEVAKINQARYDFAADIEWQERDGFASLPAVQQFDVIISNPPYVDAEDMADLPAEYRHEPIKALAGGVDGLMIVEMLLRQAADYLTPQGILIVEVGNSAAALLAKFSDLPGTWLAFTQGSSEVLLLTRQQLQDYFHSFSTIVSLSRE